MAAHPTTVVTCIHGTWGRGSRWPKFEEAVTETLAESGGPIKFRYFEWSGRNSLTHRARAAAELRRSLHQEISTSPAARHILVAHSHGANIVLHALHRAPDDLRARVAGIVFLSPPILDCRLVANPAGAANRLLLGAVAVLPVLILACLALATALDFSRSARLAGSLIAAALWLALFRPARVRRHAETLARQLALPRIDAPGLVVHVRGDEATAALSSVAAFERLARYVRSRILAVRAFGRREERGLRRARTTRDVVVAVSQALVLVPASGFWVWLLYRGVQDSRWILFTVAVPMAIVTVTGALATVGGSVLLLLLLPACSFLLWPFGIFPTTAAALLTVSVEPSPTERWDVVRLPRSAVTVTMKWKHSTHSNVTALAAVCKYLRSRVTTPSLEGRAAIR